MIVLDPKGDLTNLALSLTSPDEFAEWADDGEAARARHGAQLERIGLGFEHVEFWRNTVDVSIYAPGKTSGGGRSVNVFPTFAPPASVSPLDHERASRGVASILRAVANQTDQYDPASVFLTQAVMSRLLPGVSVPGLGLGSGQTALIDPSTIPKVGETVTVRPAPGGALRRRVSGEFGGFAGSKVTIGKRRYYILDIHPSL